VQIIVLSFFLKLIILLPGKQSNSDGKRSWSSSGAVGLVISEVKISIQIDMQNQFLEGLDYKKYYYPFRDLKMPFRKYEIGLIDYPTRCLILFRIAVS